ncbi:RagB/SusD family nutrient uptake outer membrane protein [Niabella yanshanensis]|uniref:RagB/SusD family nutrient uptake outer membrane protein n=1 Tax=Niabella yanshanensis TaxID=577386 RepID=A0ABZ0VZR6_9BACT|nr:RagB/SusD family nutrient uptake outer membrane protein [Niabella yanshanensis]WQD36515.1 RagB/SusD family nutrient uptake outer membrane protein [Niabella yanshanensis]
MNYSNIKILSIIVAMLLLSACGKGFLDVKPTNSVPAATAIKTVADARVAVNGIMRNMTNSNYYGRNFILYGDVRGGDMTLYSQGRGLDALYTFNHTVSANNFSGFWSTIYNNILQANNLIFNINKLKAEGSIENFDSFLGQALTARALMYFDLVRIYGKSYTDDKSAWGVPQPLEPLPESAQPLRSTVNDNYMQILKDLTDAAPLLPKTKSNGYLNYYGNRAIQARVYLTMGDLPAALTAAEDVINNGGYTLYNRTNWVSSWATQFGSESIFELGIFPNEGDLTTASLSFYLRRRAHGNSAALGFFGASDYFLNRLKQDATDVRWGIMLADEISTTANPRLGASYKYSGTTTLSGDGKSASTTAVNIKVIRSSEMYLIAAEAAFPTDKTKAATYLNAIRSRAPALAPATAATVTLDMILDERSKELFSEGQRYFDMLRLNRPITFNDEILGLTIPTRPKTIDRSFEKAILPIPIGEINANPGIEKQQNPGY